jgi:hypothetical protein
MEGTVPPEGGLSIRDLREKSLSIRCPLGLCSGVTSTFTELAPGGMFERWWVVPLDTLSLADLPLHLLSAEWNRRVLESLEESSTAYPRHPGEPARKFLISRLAEAARGDGGPNGVQLPSSLDLPILMEAAHHCACPTHGWEILYRWMLRQGDDGLLVHRQQEPLMATAGWLAATMIHLQRHPIHTGTRSPFPPSHNWARSIRLAILSAGLEIRRRSREGWLAARYDMLCGTGHEHWAMARLILATRLMAELRDVTITHEEATALLRVHAELRQVLSHSIARSLEHAPRGLVPPGYGIPFAPGSARTVDALLDLSPEERPVSESVLRATARALYGLTSGTPDGILQAPMDEDSATISASPLLTLYLVRILLRLGHGDEARELMKRLIQTSCDLDGGEWPGEELGATALSVLMAG